MTEVQVYEGDGEEPPERRHRLLVRCRTDVDPGWTYSGVVTDSTYESLLLDQEMPESERGLDILVTTAEGPRTATRAILGPSTPEGISSVFADDFVAASVLEKKWGTLLSGDDFKKRKMVAQMLENQEQYMKDKMP